MDTVKHSIKIYRGEQFTIDKGLVNKDGSPYIISSELENPHFLISVSDKPYAQDGRFVKNYWLPIDKTFELARAIKTSDVNDFNTLAFEDAETPSTITFKNGDAYSFYYDSAVFYVDHSTTDANSGKYVIWDLESKSWVEYSTSVRYAFATEDTSNWKPATYYYTIQLVTGTLLRPYLENLANEYGVIYNNVLPDLLDFESGNYTTNEELISLIEKAGHEFPNNFTGDQSLGVISTSTPILPPSELIVTNYMQGGVL